LRINFSFTQGTNWRDYTASCKKRKLVFEIEIYPNIWVPGKRTKKGIVFDEKNMYDDIGYSIIERRALWTEIGIS